MCTLSVSFGVFSRYPLVVAANRDEFYERPSEPPHTLSNEPVIFGPRDARAGGTWTGVNEHGVYAALTNISGVSPRDGARRSRGLLVMEALRQRSAHHAARALSGAAAPGAFNPFQAVVCDGAALFLVKYLGAPEIVRLEAGMHVFSNWDELPEVAAWKDTVIRRRIEALDRGARIGQIAPALIACLSDHAGEDWHHQLCVHTDGYGTVSSTVYAADPKRETAVFLAAEGHPCEAAFQDHSGAMQEAFGW